MSTQQLQAPAISTQTVVMPPAPKTERLLSLDVFRGFTLLSMVLVNSHPGLIYPAIAHGAWNTWTFTDLSSRVLPNLVNIRRGAVVGAPNAVTTMATITLDNGDGALTPHLPTSPYAPYLDDPGAPAFFAVRDRSDLVDTFVRPAVAAGSWGTATSGEPWVEFSLGRWATS